MILENPDDLLPGDVIHNYRLDDGLPDGRLFLPNYSGLVIAAADDSKAGHRWVTLLRHDGIVDGHDKGVLLNTRAPGWSSAGDDPRRQFKVFVFRRGDGLQDDS